MSEGDKPDDAQKTEEPTPKKLEEAKKKGQVALSKEVNHWMILLAGTMLIALASGPIFSQMQQLLRTFVEKAHLMPTGEEGAFYILTHTSSELFGIIFLVFLGLFVVAFLAPFAQIGPMFAPESIKPDISKISPIKGFERLFSMRSIMEFLKGIFKIAVVAIVSTIIMYPYFDKFGNMIDMHILTSMDELLALVIRMMIGVLVVLVVIAAIDLSYQRYEHHKQMKMTRQEVKDEHKQSEGDPHVKAKLRQLRMERGRQRMMQAVPEADVVITNPTHYAIALKYDRSEMPAPMCVAKGVDEVALRIREIAKENKVEVVENKPLARALFDVVEVEDIIPAEHFKAVAEVISYVYKQKGRH